MPKRNAVSWIGHWSVRARSRTSTIGSASDRSSRTNGTSAASPASTSSHGSAAAGPCSRMAMRPPITRPRTSVIMPRPRQSYPPVASPGTSSTPNQTSTSTTVVTIAGSISRVVIDVASTSAPEVSAPMITDSSSAPTSTAAARRVSSCWRPVSRVRRWMIATSSGNHTTYAPWRAHATRKVPKDGANATPHEASAVTAVESTSTFLWPTRSPSRASGGTHSAETISCAASNQLTSASSIPRWSAMSLKIGV